MTIHAVFLRAADANGPASVDGLPNAVVDLDAWSDEEELNAEDSSTTTMGPVSAEEDDDDDDDDDYWDEDGYEKTWESDYDVDGDLDDEPSKALEDYGEELDDPSLMAAIWEYFKSAAIAEQSYIVSKPGEEVDCYAVSNVKCAFTTQEYPVEFVIEYQPEPEEYELTVKSEMPEAEVMRRRLKASSCDDFDEIFSLWNRDINCEIKEYAHVITIKHIG
jgi:hypothetical protein